MNICKRESGCILSWWIALDDEPSRNCGDVADTTEEQAIANAHKLAAYYAREKQACDSLAPLSQVYMSYLPARDIEWHGESGVYAYVLKPRRRNGFYQVLKAIKLSYGWKDDETRQ